MAVKYITEEDTPRTNLKWELADIFREFGDNYRKSHRMPLSHKKVMHAVEVWKDIISGRTYESMQFMWIRASNI
jgi:hypothetical protein